MRRPESIAATRIPTFTLLIVLVSLFTLGLRAYCLDCHGFWGDEINSLDGASLGIPGIFTGRFGYLRNQTSLHYLIVWLTSRISDPTVSSVFVRLPSVIAGCLAVLVVYKLGEVLFGRWQGWVASLLTALSTVLLNYSQDLRPYSMLVFLTTLSVYCLVRAQQTRSGKWWIGFAVAILLDLLNSYMALTLVLPALGAFLVWALLSMWAKRRDEPIDLPQLALGLLILATGTLFTVFDTLQTPRPSPDLSHYGIQTAVSSVIELMAWFAHFGLGETLERPVQLILIVLALLGAYLGIRNKSTARQGAFLCLLFIIVPPIVLSIFATTNVVFQRYALFSVPFFFLLIAHALVSLVELSRDRLSNKRLVAIASGALGGFVTLLFLAGAYNYLSPEGRVGLSYRPDFRGAAAYLTLHARPEDTIIFIDDPGMGYTITDYYWKGIHPAPAFDARDPRLFARHADGDVYWVVSAENLHALDKLSQGDQGWADVHRFERVSVLREVHPTAGLAASMDRMVSKWEALLPGYQPVTTLRGSVYEGKGDIAHAVQTYKNAGTYFPVGDDYLQTAIGYASIGQDRKAWREALISKFWQPQRPEVHAWLSAQLKAQGFENESRVESMIAADLTQGIDSQTVGERK